jgi:F-type H+-transporting ATPase subunit b
MYAFAVLLDAEPVGQIQQIADTFGVDWPHLVAQVISFSIVCVLLQRFAYKPVLTMLDQRRQRIADGVADREKIKSELAQTETKCHELMVQANAQGKLLIAEAEQIVVKAREAAAQEHARMLAELKREVGQLVVQTAANAMGKVLTMEDQRRMVMETSERLATVA